MIVATGHRNGFWHPKSSHVAFLFERHLPARDEAGGFHLGRQGGQLEGVASPSLDEQVHLVALARRDTPIARQIRAAARAVNRLAVQLQPIAEFQQTRGTARVDCPVRRGPTPSNMPPSRPMDWMSQFRISSSGRQFQRQDPRPALLFTLMQLSQALLVSKSPIIASRAAKSPTVSGAS